MNSYHSINSWKQTNLTHYVNDIEQLNWFHGEVMRKVVEVALINMEEPAPCSFSWFVTGSGGRREQGLFSDQDHGIVYFEKTDVSDAYFARLGKELSSGMALVGYPFCEGNVMSSNPIWCQSLEMWKKQIVGWMEHSDWADIRNLQIFYDARTIYGEETLVFTLKDVIHHYCESHPNLLERLYESSRHRKELLGPFGQFLLEQKGKHVGSIDLKYGAFIPYVNSVRLLSLLEGLSQTSTLERLSEIAKRFPQLEELTIYAQGFSRLLELRISQSEQTSNYEDSHYVDIRHLTKVQRKELKRIIKDARKIQVFVRRIIDKGGLHGI